MEVKLKNSNLESKLNKNKTDFIQKGMDTYVADAFNNLQFVYDAQIIMFRVGGPLCFALAQKNLSNNIFYCSMVFFNYFGLFGYARAIFQSDSQCTASDVDGFLIT